MKTQLRPHQLDAVLRDVRERGHFVKHLQMLARWDGSAALGGRQAGGRLVGHLSLEGGVTVEGVKRWKGALDAVGIAMRAAWVTVRDSGVGPRAWTPAYHAT